MSSFSGNSKRSLVGFLTRSPMTSAMTAALSCVVCAGAPLVSAQGLHDPANYAWQPGAIKHAQSMREFVDRDTGQQTTPSMISKFGLDFDRSGMIATTHLAGPTMTSQNAFFANLGTNERTCFTCHQPQDAWSVSAAAVRGRFYASYGTDPIFRLVDGATCPSADVSSLDAKRSAYGLLLRKGLIRVGLPVPASAEYQIVSVNDPYACNTNPVTGLTHFGADGPTTGTVSVYRRPLPSTNLGFVNTIMWDGREPSLLQQSIDATLTHAQGSAAPTPAQQQQIVDFESGLFTAQVFDDDARDLTAAGAKGGPSGLVDLLANFFLGINDPLGGNPQGTPFTSKIFSLV